MKASRSPRGETRKYPIPPFVLKRLLPMGNSTESTPAALRTMASSPEGDQSAATTSSATARGAPPAETRASVLGKLIPDHPIRNPEEPAWVAGGRRTAN